MPVVIGIYYWENLLLLVLGEGFKTKTEQYIGTIFVWRETIAN